MQSLWCVRKKYNNIAPVRACKGLIDYNVGLTDLGRMNYPKAFSETPYLEPLIVQVGGML